MVKLQEAENQIVVDYVVYAQRPNDADLLMPAIETHRAKLGRTPYLVAADAGFYSAKNEPTAKAKGSSASAFPIAQPKARSADASKRSVGSATARNGGPDARDASVLRSAALRCQASLHTSFLSTAHVCA
jgi:IS5 family transposase